MWVSHGDPAVFFASFVQEPRGGCILSFAGLIALHSILIDDR